MRLLGEVSSDIKVASAWIHFQSSDFPYHGFNCNVSFSSLLSWIMVKPDIWGLILGKFLVN